MRNHYAVFAILLFCSLGFVVHAQTGNKNSTSFSLSGALHDSTRNRTIDAASVAVYKQGDDKVFSVALSSRTGKFSVQNLPVQTPFKLQISRMGYHLFEQDFVIQDSSMNLGTVYLLPKVHELEEVEILAPVRMNGDTIEFNADAFHLDSNAVAGDLLAKLPGITIWGDNEITYNGKKIAKLYVNGKDFFSSNMNIALQNLPKNIVEKVQIFDSDPETRETKNANIVLKKGKDKGIFGKIGAGLGNDKQKELEAISNLFNPSTQVSLGGTKSNINKPLNNIDQLMNNTTFGAGGLNVDYFSDLRKQGYHEDVAYGLLLKHNFRNQPTDRLGDQNELKIDLFKKSSNSLSEHRSDIVRGTSDEMENTTTTEEDRTSGFDNFRGNVNYTYKKGYHKGLDISARFEDRQIENSRTSSAVSQVYGVETRDNSVSRTEGDQRSFNLNADLKIPGKSKPNGFKWYEQGHFKYDLRHNPSSSTTHTDKRIESTDTDFVAKNFLRNTQVEREMTNQDMSAKLVRIFPKQMQGIMDIGIAQRIRIHANNSDNEVRDSLKVNELLTYEEKDRKLYSNSTLSLGKKFILDELYMRYEKSIGFSSSFDLQIIQDDIRSGYLDRNLQRTNTFVAPSVQFYYSNNVNQNFLKNLNVSWNLSYGIPSIGLMAPVIDSINLLNLTYGNTELENSRNNNISLKYSSNSFHQTGYNYDIMFQSTFSENSFVPNITYKKDGRRITYFINDQNTQESYHSSANIRKAIKLSPKNNMTVRFSNSGVLSKKGQVIDDDYDRVKNFSYNGKLDFMFNFGDALKIGMYQSFDFFQQRSSLNTNFKNTTSDSNLSLGFSIKNKAFLNTNMSYLNVENIHNSDGVFLWNISASYRALKKNNLDIKLSALDILDNNSSIITRSTSTYTIYEVNNIMRRYVMLSLSYYPRFF